jgi:hypothetical protein
MWGDGDGAVPWLPQLFGEDVGFGGVFRCSEGLRE